MTDMELLDQVNRATKLLRGLYGLTLQQQRHLAANELLKCEELFIERQKLFEEVQQTWTPIYKSPELYSRLSDESAFSEAWSGLREARERFIASDEKLYILISKLQERLHVEMLEKMLIRMKAKEYREVDKATGLVAQVFPSKSRTFDERR